MRKVRGDKSPGLLVFGPGVKLFAVIFGVLVVLGSCGYFISVAFRQLLERPIAHIGIEGDFTYLQRSAVVGLISENIQYGFVGENLTRLKRELEANAWIERVELRRRWPDTLLVTVVEQRPIARWGNRGFVNYRGEHIPVSEPAALAALPLLRGEDERSFEVMKQYQLLSELLAQYQLSLRELQQNKPGVWTLYLDNGWTLIAGRAEVLQKTQRFMQLIANERIEQPHRIAVVDMRYPNGLAVQWDTHKPETGKPTTGTQEVARSGG